MATAARQSSSRRPRQIYEDLRRRIEDGAFPVGVPFPTEERLCADEGVSRYALREALAMLEAEGLIRRRRGAGTSVISRTPTSVFRHATGSRAELLTYVVGTSLRWTGIGTVRTTGALARLLGCDEMREWQYLRGVRHDADGEPLAIVDVYVDPQRAPLPKLPDLEGSAVYEWIEREHGIRLATLSQDIRAKPLSPKEAELLSEAAGASVLQIIRRYFDAGDAMYQIAVTTHRARDFVYNLRVQVRD